MYRETELYWNICVAEYLFGIDFIYFIPALNTIWVGGWRVKSNTWEEEAGPMGVREEEQGEMGAWEEEEGDKEEVMRQAKKFYVKLFSSFFY